MHPPSLPAATKTQVMGRWGYRLQLAAILGVVAMLIILRPQKGEVKAQPQPTLFDAVNQFTHAATRFDTAAAQPWLVSGQEESYEQWSRSQLNPAFHTTPGIKPSDFRLRIEKEALPLTWVEVTLPRAMAQDAVVYEAWWRDAEGNWRFDCDATRHRIAEELDVPDIPPASSEPLLLL